MVFMGLTGWRNVKTGKRYGGQELSDAWEQPKPGHVPIIENVDHHDGEALPYKLRIVSLHQPYASLLIVAKVKRHETRSWIWPEKMLGQQVGIHAAKTMERLMISNPLRQICAALFGADYEETLPRGAILGACIPVTSTPTAITPPESAEDVYAGDWGPGRFATRMRSRDAWARPIPWKGQQGFWTVTTDQLNAAIAADITENWRP